MERSVLNQLHKLLFFVIISGATQTQHFSLKDYQHKINNHYEKTDEELEDEKLLQELWSVADDFYKKIITITALYFSGVFMASDQVSKEIMYELGKHILYSGQIFALYLPKLLYNPHISWRVKAKRCGYASCFLILVAFWMQKIYKPAMIKNSTNLQSIPTGQPDYTNYATPLQNTTESSHRPRPKLF